jgi:hypothetical protein
MKSIPPRKVDFDKILYRVNQGVLWLLLLPALTVWVTSGPWPGWSTMIFRIALAGMIHGFFLYIVSEHNPDERR